MLELHNVNILVVGGAGFIGSNLVKMLLQSLPAKIMIIDNLLSAEEINAPKHSVVQFVKGSITDDEILRGITDEFDFIFHLATYHGNQSSIADPLADHENNTLTTLKLYERIKTFRRLKKVVYSSAGCTVAKKTFDDARPTTENDPVSLVQDSPYAISKIIGEFYSVYYHKQHSLPTVRARFQNVYGPGEILGAGKWRGTPATVWRNVVPVFVYKALNKMSLPLENNGVATRDFIYVEDICRGLVKCALKGSPGEVYNIASGQETSIRELTEIINTIAENPAGVELLPKRAWDTSGKRVGCAAKSRSELGFEANTPLREGLHKTITWTTENMCLIQSCIEKHRQHLGEASTI
jgi:UDP-glucose 4-epimerase